MVLIFPYVMDFVRQIDAGRLAIELLNPYARHKKKANIAQDRETTLPA